MTASVVLRSRISAPAEAVRAYLARGASAPRLLPPWEDAQPARVHSEVSPDGDASVLEETFPARSRERGERWLAFRARTLRLDLARRARLPQRPLRVAITGASGFIGTALSDSIAAMGDTVVRLVRRAPRTGDEIAWDPGAGTLDRAGLAGVDAVVHLAGESVAGGRWTEDRKRRIRESRVRGTELVARALAESPRPAAVLVSASGVNVYGTPGERPVDEGAPRGDDFLAEVASAWEGAAAPAAARGIRVVHPRFGAVLSPRGGMLAKLLAPFRAGVGGRVGGGHQWLSWVSLEDTLGAIHHAIADARVSGPMNVVAPEPVTNASFTRALGQALGRPTVVPLPAFAVSLAFGEMGRVLLLSGQRVVPRVLQETGYQFVNTAIAPTLAELLGRGPVA